MQSIQPVRAMLQRDLEQDRGEGEVGVRWDVAGAGEGDGARHVEERRLGFVFREVTLLIPLYVK